MRASNAGGVGKNCDTHQYLASSHVVNTATAKCTHSYAGPWQVGDSHQW